MQQEEKGCAETEQLSTCNGHTYMEQAEKEENPASGDFYKKQTGRLLRRGYICCWASQVMGETSKGHRGNYNLLKHWSSKLIGLKT